MQAIYLCLVFLSLSLCLTPFLKLSVCQFWLAGKKNFHSGKLFIYMRGILSCPFSGHASFSACRVAYEISLSIHSTQGHFPNNSSNISPIIMMMMMLVFALWQLCVALGWAIGKFFVSLARVFFGFIFWFLTWEIFVKILQNISW